MSLNEEWIEAKLTELRGLIRDEYDVRDVSFIPSANQVGLGNKAVKADVCVLSLDIRDSSSLIEVHQRKTVGKLHKAFLTCAADAIREGGGKVRNYTGDGLLAFWNAESSDAIQAAVDTAIFFTDAFNLFLNREFEHYRGIQFGIGIDQGQVHILRAGLSTGQHNSDLVYIGSCVNFACRMANQAKPPYSIRVSPGVASDLRPDQVVDNPDAWVFKGRRWRETTTTHRGHELTCYARRDGEHHVELTL